MRSETQQNETEKSHIVS